MKIICVGRNYRDHARELQNQIPEEPVLFLKPQTALLLKNQPFFIPDFSAEVHHEIEIVIRINRVGKNIQARFAHKYYEQFALGIDFTARDVQQRLKAKGLPWEKAKAFDGSAYMSSLLNCADYSFPQQPVPFALSKNGQTVQQGNSADMLFGIHQLIAHISQYFTLKIGDLIFTGTPAGVGSIDEQDRLELFLQNKKVGEVHVK